MAEIDKTKEEIGWLKVEFALLAATDVSLIGWTAQNALELPTALWVASVALILALTIAGIVTSQKAQKKIEQLENM